MPESGFRKKVLAEMFPIFRFFIRKAPATIGATTLFGLGLAMIYRDDFGLGITALTRVLLSVGVDANDQNLLQRDALL